jgi:hypothetical protein
MWRYRELLPVAEDPTVGLQVGFTAVSQSGPLGEDTGHIVSYGLRTTQSIIPPSHSRTVL